MLNHSFIEPVQSELVAPIFSPQQISNPRFLCILLPTSERSNHPVLEPDSENGRMHRHSCRRYCILIFGFVTPDTCKCLSQKKTITRRFSHHTTVFISLPKCHSADVMHLPLSNFRTTLFWRRSTSG